MSAKICRHLLVSGNVLVFEDGYTNEGFLIDGTIVWRASFPDFKAAERCLEYLGEQSVISAVSISSCVVIAGGKFIRRPWRLSFMEARAKA